MELGCSPAPTRRQSSPALTYGRSSNPQCVYHQWINVVPTKAAGL